VEEAFTDAIHHLDGTTLSRFRLLLAGVYTARGLTRAADPAHRPGTASDFDRALGLIDHLIHELSESAPRLRAKAVALNARGTLRASATPPAATPKPTSRLPVRSNSPSLTSKSRGMEST
jgi:hypothetical protein